MRDRDAAYLYAKALFSLAPNEQWLMKGNASLKSFDSLVNKMPKFRQYLLNPEVEREKKKILLQKSIEDTLLVNFILFILEKKRFHNLQMIVDAFSRMTLDSQQIVKALIISASTLDEDTRKGLQQKLEHYCKKPIVLEERVEPTILGGAILIVGNQFVDFSVQGRLQKMKKILLG